MGRNWDKEIGLKSGIRVGLEHKVWETVLFLQGNVDLDMIPGLASDNLFSFRSRMRHCLRVIGSALAIDALFWDLVGS